MTDRVVLCMVIDGKATLYEQTNGGAEAFSTLRAPTHFDEHRAMAWALGTLSVLALDEVHETNGHEQRALPAAKPNGHKPQRATPRPSRTSGSWSEDDVLTLIEGHPGLTRVELRDMTGLESKTIGNRLSRLTRTHRIYRSDGDTTNKSRYYPVRRS